MLVLLALLAWQLPLLQLVLGCVGGHIIPRSCIEAAEANIHQDCLKLNFNANFFELLVSDQGVKKEVRPKFKLT